MTTDTKWGQVHDYLRDRITAGDLKPGDRLPPEPELMRRYGIGGRGTINRAVRALVGEGLVGEDRRVTARKPITLRLSHEETLTFIEDMVRSGHVLAPPEITVKIEGGTLVREVLRVVDGQPHNWARWSFPLEIAQGTRLAYDTDIAEGSIRYLKEGLPWSRLVQAEPEIEARMPSPEEARVLRMPPGEPVIVEYRGGAQDGTVIFGSVRILRAGLTRLVP